MTTKKTMVVKLSAEVFGSTFHFVLNTRRLALTNAISIQYYWMDAGALRNPKDTAGVRNSQESIALFRQVVHSFANDDPIELRTVVLAMAHLILCNSKGVQNVLRDALLSSKVIKRQKNGEFLLDDEDQRRVDEVAAQRDAGLVAQELDRILNYSALPSERLEEHLVRFEEWVGQGVLAIQSGNEERMISWTTGLERETQRLRKSGDEIDAEFLNSFAYEAKVSFYHCYVNAWSSSLLPLLLKDHALDEVSCRFLRFWHHQQAATPISKGITSGGILYPVSQKTFLVDSQGRALGAEFSTQQIGPDHRPAVFRGQVLALHPLSGFFMNDPVCLLAAARFFATDSYDFVFRRGGVGLSSDYWELVRQILISAHRYRISRSSYEDFRGHRQRGFR